MTSGDIERAAIDAIARQKNIDPGSIGLDSSLSELSISSLDAITIVYEIEEQFDIEVPNESLSSLETVRDIVEGVARLLNPDR
ncbi:MAG: acyl carrier protein [Chromatiales bacterium]|jgi:acyl carrier protein